MDSHKNQKAFVQVAKWIEWTSDHNECCSAPSPRSFPACNLCERHTFAKHKKKPVTEFEHTDAGEMIMPA